MSKQGKRIKAWEGDRDAVHTAEAAIKQFEGTARSMGIEVMA